MAKVLFKISLVILLVSSVATLYAATCTWTNGNGTNNWSDPLNWDCGLVPGAGDDVIIPGSSNTINLDVNATVDEYTHNTSSILNQVGANVLTVTNLFTWHSGTVRAMVNCTGNMSFGTGTQLLQQAMTVSGITSSVSTSSFYVSNNGSNLGKFTNDGTFNWAGDKFDISSSSNGYENNGSLNVSVDDSIDGNNVSTFVNNGTFTKNGGTGTFTFAPKYINNGDIIQTSGSKLDFNGGLDNNNGGTISMNASSTLEISGTGTLATGSSISGAEILRLSNGVTVNQAPAASIDLDFFASTVNWNVDYTTANVDMGGSSMTLQGTGSITVTNSLLFQRIILKIPTTVNAGATCTIDNAIGGTRQINNTSLTLKGTTNMTAGTLDFGAGGALQNSGTFNWSGGNITLDGQSITNTGTFNASGDLLLSGSGTFTNSNNFNRNGGTGSLSMSCNVDNNGTFEQTTAGTINFSIFTFNNNNTLQGIGTFDVGTFNQNSTVSPGQSPGIMGFDQFNNGSGIYELEMQGNTTAGTDYDQIQVSGAGTLSGTLNITFLNGYEPSVGNQFTIMTCNPCNVGTVTINHPGNNPNAFSAAVMGNTIVLTMVQALPVELLHFDLSKKENDIALEWATATETNNLGFEIEHSKNGARWKKIGFVEGQGNTATKTEYLFKDNSPHPGVNYYRLRQIGLDGHAEYSEIRSADFNSDGRFTISPNPASQSLKIKPMTEIPFGSEWSILNSNGILIKKGNWEDQSELTINLSTWPAGTYIFRAYFNGRYFSEKIIKK